MFSRKILAWSLVLAPPLFLLAYVLLYAVNGPEWDHMSSAEIFYRWDEGRFTFEYLFRQHNEHRKAVPRLVTLGLGLLTRWNNRPEAVLHWALMCATGVVLYAAFRRDTPPRESRTGTLLFFVPIACLLASPRSYEALLGDGFPHYCSILAFAGGLYILIYARPTFAALAGAIACGLAASFSISNGLLIWPIGVVILAAEMRSQTARGATWSRAIAWGIAGTVTIAAYFYHYVDPGNHSGPGFVLQHPLKALAHFLTANGSSLAPDPYVAIPVGALVLTLEAFCLAIVFDDWWRRRVRPPLGAWLIITVVISMVMITLNRAGFGFRQAIESRYTGLSVLGPIGLYWCLVARETSWRLAHRLRPAVAVFLLAGFAYASLDAWRIAPAWYSRKSWMSYLMYSAKYQPSSLLEKLYPNPDHARIYSAQMERMRYNVFAEEHLKPEDLELDAPRPDFRIETVNDHRAYGADPIEIAESGAIVVTGWAYNEAGTGPAQNIFLTVDGTRDLPGHMGIYHPDRGGRVRHRSRRWSGFTASVGGFVLPPGEHTLSLKIVPDEGRHAFLTQPFARVVRR